MPCDLFFFFFFFSSFPSPYLEFKAVFNSALLLREEGKGGGGCGRFVFVLKLFACRLVWLGS